MSRKWTLNTIKNFSLTLEDLVSSHLDAWLLLLLSARSRSPARCQLVSSSLCFSQERASGVHGSKELFHSAGILSVGSSPPSLVHFVVISPVLQSQSPFPSSHTFGFPSGHVTHTDLMQSWLDFVHFRETRRPRWSSVAFPSCWKIPQFVTEQKHGVHVFIHGRDSVGRDRF